MRLLLVLAILSLSGLTVHQVLSVRAVGAEEQSGAASDTPGSAAAPSGPGATPTPDLAAGGGTAPRVRSDVTVREYRVQGDDEVEILQSLLANAPVSGEETFFGLTTSELTFRYWRQPDAAGCTLVDLHVDLGVTIDLPVWSPSGAAPYELKRDWDRFAMALKRHEETHRDYAIRGAEEVLEALQGIRAPTCDAAVAEAQRRAERFQIETEAAHRHYDDQTGHGRTEGAVWPVQ
jgi:predicted secreted Zn-dependent protease